MILFLNVGIKDHWLFLEFLLNDGQDPFPFTIKLRLFSAFIGKKLPREFRPPKKLSRFVLSDDQLYYLMSFCCQTYSCMDIKKVVLLRCCIAFYVCNLGSAAANEDAPFRLSKAIQSIRPTIKATVMVGLALVKAAVC